MADLSVNIGDLKLCNPVMTASGTFGYGKEFEDFVDLEKIGGIIVKGTTLHHREGNPYPRMAETPICLLYTSSEIDKIKTLRGELPLEVQDLEDEVAGLSTRIEKMCIRDRYSDYGYSGASVLWEFRVSCFQFLCSVIPLRYTG